MLLWHTTVTKEGIDLTEGTEGEDGKMSFSDWIWNDFLEPLTRGYFGVDDDWELPERGNKSMSDVVVEGSNQIEKVYEGMFSADDRLFLDSVINNTPIIGEMRNVVEQIRKTNDYLKNTGLSYDDIAYKGSFGSGLSGSLEHLYQGTVGRASRGVKSVHDVYSR